VEPETPQSQSPPQESIAPAATAPSDLRRAGRLAKLLGTWPRRVGALAGSAALGWIVSQTLPALWQETSKRVGLVPKPVQVVLVSQPDVIKSLDSIENYEFVVRRPIASVGAPPHGSSELGRYNWGKSMGGIDAGSTVLRLVIRGRSDSPVILDNLEVEVADARPPLRGTLVSYLGQGAGEPVRFFEINLDHQPATVKYLQKGEDTAVFPYRVSKTDVEVFDIYAYTLRHDVRWRLRLDYTSADKQGTMVFDDQGRPFETTAVAERNAWHELGEKTPAPQRGYGWFKGKWVEFAVCC
jgi:hypothetical protein